MTTPSSPIDFFCPTCRAVPGENCKGPGIGYHQRRHDVANGQEPVTPVSVSIPPSVIYAAQARSYLSLLVSELSQDEAPADDLDGEDDIVPKLQATIDLLSAYLESTS